LISAALEWDQSHGIEAAGQGVLQECLRSAERWLASIWNVAMSFELSIISLLLPCPLPSFYQTGNKKQRHIVHTYSLVACRLALLL
jgi:hypothetical protein